jgi:ElaB/YqjD/DUF883 family membrane-anchored ribosome-binding protein
MNAIRSIPSKSKGLVGRSSGLLREGTDRARRLASRATDRTVLSVHKRPMRSLLVAGAAGAVIALLAGAAVRPRH